MLNDRIRKWNRGKNIKSHEMQKILSQLQARERDQKRTEIRFHGMAVSKTKVKRYQKINASELRCEVDRVKSSRSPILEIRTPPASPLTMPRSLRIPEELIKCIRDYISGAFAEKLWVSVGDAKRVEQSEENLGIGLEFFGNLQNAVYTYSTGHFDAWRILGKAERNLEGAIRSQDNGLIECFLRSIHFLGAKSSEFILPTIERSSSIAIEILGHGHPLARSVNLICLFVREAESTSLLAGIESAWRSATDSIEYCLGRLHFTALVFRLQYVNKIILTRDYNHGLSILRQLLRDCEEKCCGLEDVRPLEVRLYLAVCLAKASNGHCEEAIVVATKVIDTTLQPRFPSSWIDWFQSEAHYQIAFAQMKLGHEALSEKNMRKAIHISLAAFGAHSAQTLNLMIVFEKWLRDWGKIEAADEIRDQLQVATGSTSDDEDSDVVDEGDWDLSEDEESEVVDEGDWELSEDDKEMDIEG